MSDIEQELDVRVISPPQKHPTIFKTFDNLGENEAFILVNDHDPKPLRYQMTAMLGEEAFHWEYLEEGPEVWKVRIGKNAE